MSEPHPAPGAQPAGRGGFTLPPRRRSPGEGPTALNVEQLSAGIYGTIIASVGIAGAADLPLTGVVISGAFAVAVYWSAERYTDWLAHRTLGGGATPTSHLRDSLPMLYAGAVPLAAVLVFWLPTRSVSTATTVALSMSAAMLGVVGGVAARRSGLSVPRSLLAAAVAALLGLAVVALKLSLHR